MIYLERQGFVERYNLEPSKTTFQIGRNKASDFQFSSPFISRQHCEIQRIPPSGLLIIKNCTPTNSTHVDNTELNGANQVAELKVGALIGLGVPTHMCIERLKDDRFVYLKVCQETLNKVSRELNEANLTTVLQESTVTANISQEEIDISNFENVPHNDEIEIVYSSAIVDKEFEKFCIKKESSLFPEIAGSSNSSRTKNLEEGDNQNFNIKQEGNALLDGQIILNSDVPCNGIPSINFVKSIQESNSLLVKGKGPSVPKKHISQSESSSSLERDFKLNSNNEIFKEGKNNYQLNYASKKNVHIRECKLEISNSIEEELEKVIQYEILNEPPLFQPRSQHVVKKEIISSDDQQIQEELVNMHDNFATNKEVDPGFIILSSDSSSDEEDAVPSGSPNQNHQEKEKLSHYSDVNVKKREYDDDSGPSLSKRFKKNTNNLLSPSKYFEKITTFEPNIPSFSGNIETRGAIPKTSLISQDCDKLTEKEHILEPLPPMQHEQVKKCIILLKRLPEDNIRSLVDVPSYCVKNVPFEKNNIISDSESNSESEMSIDDTEEENGKENLQNLNQSLENLCLEDEANLINVSPVEHELLNENNMSRVHSNDNDVSKVNSNDNENTVNSSNNDLSRVNSNDLDISRVKKEPLSKDRLESLFGGESSDEDDNDFQISYSQVDDIILVSSDDESSFNVESSSQNASYSPLPSADVDELTSYDRPLSPADLNELELPDLLNDDRKDDNEEAGEEDWWPALSQKFENDNDQDDYQRKEEMEKEKKTDDENNDDQDEYQRKEEMEKEKKSDEESDDDQDDYQRREEIEKENKIDDDHGNHQRKKEMEKKKNLNNKKDDIEEDREEEWWPTLSQNFEIDDDQDNYQRKEEKKKKIKKINEEMDDNQDQRKKKMEKEKKTNEEREKQQVGAPSKDLHLQSIINKINNKHVAKSKLTEPKMPPPRTKMDTIPKKRRRSINTEQEVTSKPTKINTEIPDDGWLTKPTRLDEAIKFSEPSASKKLILSPTTSKLRGKKSDIRKTLQKTHNFEIYKGKPEKKHYHLVNKSSKEKEKMVNSEIGNHQKENISILPKNKENIGAVKKGIAKISSKSRSEKLTEVDLFGSCVEAKPKAHTKFKIPKVSKIDGKNRRESGDKSSPHSILDIANKQSRKEYSKEIPGITDNGNIPSTSNNSNVTEMFEHSIGITDKQFGDSKSKGILKDLSKPTKKQMRVHFPSNENLVVIRPISPRQNKNCHGPDVVRDREKYFGQSIMKSVIKDPLEFILKICNWNFDWLKTYHEAKKNVKNPTLPNLCDDSALPTFTIYKSLNDYQQVFANMLYYEAWENIYRDWEQHVENISFLPCEIDVREEKYIGEKKLKYFKIKAVSFVTSEVSMQDKHPTTGSLIAVKHRRGDKFIYTFGYVEGYSKRNGSCVSENLKKVSKSSANTVIIFEIIFSKQHIESDFRPGMIASFYNISYFRPTYRAFECLFHLRSSPLLPFILNPGDLIFFDSRGTHKNYLITQLEMNEFQMKSIVEASRKCVSDFDRPNLSLIHGPPGTGKTRVIVALISQINLMFKNSKHSSNRRILLCAPSNAAVDDLVLRIGKLKMHGIHLNIVRVGVKKSMHPDVGEYSFDVKVNKEFEKRQYPTEEKIRTELKEKNKFCEQAAEDLQKARKESNPNPEKIKQLDRRLLELVRSRKKFEDSCKFKLNRRDSDKIYRECRKKVLMTAEIIAATLTSCLSGAIMEVFGKNKSPFACCIVDEAGQCKESEIWFPLQLGIKKLVLVGDHLQLPATALSQLCQGKNLHQSLFERVYHHVGVEKCRLDVIHTLNVQYRMHEDILSWPSLHFYNNELVTAPNISELRKHNLCPYLVFDVTKSGEEEKNTGEIFNMREALFIQALLQSQEKYLQGLTIGVLTPYAKQKQLLIEKLSHLVHKHKITVSTIDNFQGQEKDVIYCSFVRSNSSRKIGFVSDRHRLNVALTRARKSCFIVGDLKSLQSNSDWRALIEDARRRNLVKSIPSTMNIVAEKNVLLQMALTDEAKV